MAIELWSEIIGAVSGEGVNLPTPTTSSALIAFNWSYDTKRISEVIRLTSALDGTGSAQKKKFWSVFNSFDFDPASLLVPSTGNKTTGVSCTPHWHNHTSLHVDESFLSKKQLAAIRNEVMDEWRTILPDSRIWVKEWDESKFMPSLDFGPDAYVPYGEIVLPELTDAELYRIELVIRRAVEKRVRRIHRFSFKRSRASLRRTDAIRVDILSYRVRTGISPPEMEPSWATSSSIKITDPFSNSKEKYYVPVRRRADRRRFQRTAQEGRAGQRRAPSHQADRHAARSHEARGLPNCGARAYRQTPEHRPTGLLLQH